MDRLLYIVVKKVSLPLSIKWLVDKCLDLYAVVGKERRSKIMISASLSASVLMALLGFCLYYYYCIRSKKTKNNISSHQETERSNTEFQLLDFDDSLITENQVDSLDFPSIELDVIHKATQHFSEANKLGEGGFGPVYKVNKTMVGLHILLHEF